MSKIKSKINQNKDEVEHLIEEKILADRLRKAWLLTCEAYGIDPENPPKMEKKMFFAGSHEEHQKYMDEEDKKFREKTQKRDLKN